MGGCSKQAPNLSKSSVGPTGDTNPNRPRNHLIINATRPFDFKFRRFGVTIAITVHQTPEDDVWPGGALWDLGVLLAQVLVGVTRGTSVTDTKATTVPKRLLQAVPEISWKNTIVLELGCGVGLTGLVAAALGAKITLLTDLQVVVDQVVQRNVECNTLQGPSKLCGYRTTRTGGRLVAMPLCWGNEHDEEDAKAALIRLNTAKQTSKRKPLAANGDPSREGIPDLIIIGDVAYQHKPGAPSHFEALVSTLLKFMDNETLVLFGTRMRMPASADLLAMFRMHMDEVVDPPIEAHELNSSFSENELGRKHNMTIHVLRLRKEKDSDREGSTV